MSASCLRFLTVSQVRRLYDMGITIAQPTQYTYLESAIYSPQQHKHYGEEDLFQLAGVLAEKIVLNHAYQDGNKRTSLLAANMFLKMNGYQLQKELSAGDTTSQQLQREHSTRDKIDQQLQYGHIDIATKQWDAEQLASLYRSISTPIPHITAEIEQ